MGGERGPIEVLIVDDDAHLVRPMTRQLKQLRPSWRVATETNGDRALEILQSVQTFDAILLDLFMGASMSGPALFGQLRATARPRAERVCFVSGGSELQQRFLNEAGRPVLYKPVEIEDVIAMIERLATLDVPRGPDEENEPMSPPAPPRPRQQSRPSIYDDGFGDLDTNGKIVRLSVVQEQHAQILEKVQAHFEPDGVIHRMAQDIHTVRTSVAVDEKSHEATTKTRTGFWDFVFKLTGPIALVIAALIWLIHTLAPAPAPPPKINAADVAREVQRLQQENPRK